MSEPVSPSDGPDFSDAPDDSESPAEPDTAPRVCFVPDCSEPVAASSPNYCRAHLQEAERWRAEKDRDTRVMARQLRATMTGGAGSGGAEDGAPRRPAKRAQAGREWDREPDILSVLRRPAWWADAACRETDPSVFVPERETRAATAQARRMCAGCRVKPACLAFALDDPTVVGIFGSTSSAERRALRRAVSRDVA